MHVETGFGLEGSVAYYYHQQDHNHSKDDSYRNVSRRIEDCENRHDSNEDQSKDYGQEVH